MKVTNFQLCITLKSFKYDFPSLDGYATSFNFAKICQALIQLSPNSINNNKKNQRQVILSNFPKLHAYLYLIFNFTKTGFF